MTGEEVDDDAGVFVRDSNVVKTTGDSLWHDVEEVGEGFGVGSLYHIRVTIVNEPGVRIRVDFRLCR